MTTQSHPPTDHALLHQFAAGNPAAFESLVQRHAHWIYSIAFRGLRNPAAAEDATQAVFLLLAQRAARLPAATHIPGWLFQATTFAVKNIRRAETRRRHHERKAATMPRDPSPTPPADDPDTAALKATLDHAVLSLSARDRTALLLRYYQNHPLPQIAAALHTTEEGARKQISRALDHLRQKLHHKNLPIASPALATFFTTRLTETAPANLHTTLLATSTHTAPPAISALTHAVSKSMTFKGATLMATTAPIKIAAATAALLLITASTAAVYHALAANPPPTTPPTAANPPATRPAAVIDLSTPDAALTSVFSAIRAEDSATLARCMYATTPTEEKLNTAWVAGTIASQRLLRTMHDHFGDDALLDAHGHPWLDDYSPLFLNPALEHQQLPNIPGTLVGNDEIGWARLVQQNTQWKFAIAQTYGTPDQITQITPPIQFMADRINNLATQIDTGQCPTLDEARNGRLTATGGRILLNPRAFTSTLTPPAQ